MPRGRLAGHLDIVMPGIDGIEVSNRSQGSSRKVTASSPSAQEVTSWPARSSARARKPRRLSSSSARRMRDIELTATAKRMRVIEDTNG